FSCTGNGENLLCVAARSNRAGVTVFTEPFFKKGIQHFLHIHTIILLANLCVVKYNIHRQAIETVTFE
ncbi:MAG: hypothetical protein IKB82_06765, partial [Clostridia bacterium]|nr:hypothetical protein [Clostridia bacterium]